MKKKWNRLKCTIRYYWSVMDIAVTGFVFDWIHIITKRRRPKRMSEEMLEQLKRLVEEKTKEHPR